MPARTSTAGTSASPFPLISLGLRIRRSPMIQIPILPCSTCPLGKILPFIELRTNSTCSLPNLLSPRLYSPTRLPFHERYGEILLYIELRTNRRGLWTAGAGQTRKGGRRGVLKSKPSVEPCLRFYSSLLSVSKNTDWIATLHNLAFIALQRYACSR